MDKQLTGAIIAHANERAIEACKRLGVPLARVQKLIMSKEWQKDHRAKVAEVFKKKGTK